MNDETETVNLISEVNDEQWSSVIQVSRNKILAIHPATFEPDWYTRQIFTTPIAERFLRDAVVIIHDRTIYHMRIPFLCHDNPWSYAYDRLAEDIRYTGHPYIGWRLFEQEEGLKWSIHSMVVEKPVEGGTVVIESGGSVPAGAPVVYLATAWDIYVIKRMAEVASEQTAQCVSLVG